MNSLPSLYSMTCKSNCICLSFYILFSVIVAAFSSDSLSSHASTTVCAYRQSIGGKVDTVYRSFISSADEITITYKEAATMKTEAHCDSALNIHSWHFENKESGYNITVKRFGDTLLITGKMRAKTIRKSQTIDASPWYQSMEFSLLLFLKSRAHECEFWMIRPTDMKAFKMIARRKAIETVRVTGRSEQAVRVTLSPTGLGGRFWQATYWYRADDYAFAKSSMPRSILGTSPLILESIGMNRPEHQ